MILTQNQALFHCSGAGALDSNPPTGQPSSSQLKIRWKTIGKKGPVGFSDKIIHWKHWHECCMFTTKIYLIGVCSRFYQQKPANKIQSHPNSPSVFLYQCFLGTPLLRCRRSKTIPYVDWNKFRWEPAQNLAKLSDQPTPPSYCSFAGHFCMETWFIYSYLLLITK